MEFSEITVSQDRNLPLTETTICPIGDLQYGAFACDIERFKEHIAYTQSLPNPWYIGMGDYCDFGSPSNRGALQALIDQGTLYDTAQDVLNGAAQEHLEEVAELLRPTHSRWLGMLAEHHFWTFPNGETSDMRLCQLLDAPFLGTCAVVRVILKSGKRAPDVQLKIWAHHGRGSGTSQAAPLNKLEKIAAGWEDIDVFFMAHHHKQAMAKIARLRPKLGNSPRLYEREVTIAATGGFLRGYVEQARNDGMPRATYVEDKLLNPLPLGAPVVLVTPEAKSDGTPDIKTRVIN